MAARSSFYWRSQSPWHTQYVVHATPALTHLYWPRQPLFTLQPIYKLRGALSTTVARKMNSLSSIPNLPGLETMELAVKLVPRHIQPDMMLVWHAERVPPRWVDWVQLTFPLEWKAFFGNCRHYGSNSFRRTWGQQIALVLPYAASTSALKEALY